MRTLLPVALLVVLLPGWALAAPEVETRDFTVFVDGKPSGDLHMTFNKQEDGTVAMNCDTDIKVSVKVGLLTKHYYYSFRGREVWKGGRLQRFDSACNDNGNRYVVSATAAGDKVRVRINNDEPKMARGDVWLSSYWAMPDKSKIGQTLPIIDADNGNDISAKVTFLGVEQRSVAEQVQKVSHFRLVGKSTTDLWYDATGRLVAQEWIEQGYRTQVELNRLRR